MAANQNFGAGYIVPVEISRDDSLCRSVRAQCHFGERVEEVGRALQLFVFVCTPGTEPRGIKGIAARQIRCSLHVGSTLGDALQKPVEIFVL